MAQLNSPLITTEPAMTRAFAAEIREHPGQFTEFVNNLLNTKLGKITDIICEGPARLDIFVKYANGDTVGIEAKFDHHASTKQLKKERKEVTYLILMVLNKEDGADFKNEVNAVITWEQAIQNLPDSRIRVCDLKVPTPKHDLENIFKSIKQDMRQYLPEEAWELRVTSQGGSGMTRIEFWSKQQYRVGEDCPRQLRGNIQVPGRGNKNAEFQSFLGIEIHVGDSKDFPAPEQGVEPGWMQRLEELDTMLDCMPESGRIEDLGFRDSVGRRRKDVPNMRELVDSYIFEKRYLIKGYRDWAFGIRSTTYSLDDLHENAVLTAKIMRRWEQEIVAQAA